MRKENELQELVWEIRKEKELSELVLENNGIFNITPSFNTFKK